MKNKILAFLTALVLGFLGVLASTPIVSYASAVDTIGNIVEIISGILDLKENFNTLLELKDEAQGIERTNLGHKVVITMRDVFKKYPDFTKQDFVDFFYQLNLSFGDPTSVNEKYGLSLSTDDGSYLFNLIHDTCWCFDCSLDELADILYDKNYSDSSINEDGDVEMPTPAFKKYVDDLSNNITPKNRKYQKYSWRDLSEEYYESSQVNFGSGNFARYIPMETITIENACGIEGNTKQYKGFYLQSYMERKGSSYFQPYQYLFYCEEHEYEGASPDSNVSSPVWYTHYNWYCRPIFYETLDGVSIDTFDVLAAGLDSKYIPSTDPASGERVFLPVYPNYCSLGFNSNGQISLSFGDDLGSIRLNYPIYWQFALNNNFMQACSPFYNSNYAYFLKYDNVLDKIPLIYGTVRDVNTGANVVRSGLRHFFLKGSDSMGISTYPIRYHDSGDPNGRMTDIVTCDEDHTCDFGFYVSNEQFTTTYKIDTSRIPSNAVITIKGGDVYTWNITDETTGDTITIGELIDSDYVIPPSTPGNTSGGGNGGGNGGNVNVGGDVKVDGTVTVSGGVDINVSVPDINVNVNVSGGVGVGGNGGGVNASLPDMSPVDEYLESAADDSSGFRRFLADFFSFLPNDIILLLGIAISVAIVCRLLGR